MEKIKRKTRSHIGTFIVMFVLSLSAHLFAFYFLAKRYPDSLDKIEIPKIKSVKGYLISQDELLIKEVLKIKQRTKLAAPKYTPPPPKQVVPKNVVKLPPKEVEKPKPKKTKRQIEKDKALENIKKKIEKKIITEKKLPIKTDPTETREAPKAENFPVPEGWKETETAKLKIPLGSQTGNEGGKELNEDMINYEIAKYGLLLKDSIIGNFILSNKRALRENPDIEIHVSVKTDSNGRLIFMELVKSSGVDSLDGQCLSAIKKTEPFPRPPLILKGRSSFTFKFIFPGKDLLKLINEE
ncbi:MAG: TonB family protein [Pseudomonadota bacterium]